MTLLEFAAFVTTAAMPNHYIDNATQAIYAGCGAKKAIVVADASGIEGQNKIIFR